MFYNQIVKHFREKTGLPIASSYQLMDALGGSGRARDFLLQVYCEETGESPDELQGGMQHRVDRDMYKQTKWISLRKKFLRENEHICTECGKPGDQVDHIKPRSKYPELAYDWSNLQIMCVDCNKRKGNSD